MAIEILSSAEIQRMRRGDCRAQAVDVSALDRAAPADKDVGCDPLHRGDASRKSVVGARDVADAIMNRLRAIEADDDLIAPSHEIGRVAL